MASLLLSAMATLISMGSEPDTVRPLMSLWTSDSACTSVKFLCADLFEYCSMRRKRPRAARAPTVLDFFEDKSNLCSKTVCFAFFKTTPRSDSLLLQQVLKFGGYQLLARSPGT